MIGTSSNVCELDACKGIVTEGHAKVARVHTDLFVFEEKFMKCSTEADSMSANWYWVVF